MSVSKNLLFGAWEGFEINISLILTLKTPIMTKCTVSFCDVLLEFQGENIPWYFIWIIYQQTIHMKCCPYLVSKTATNFKSVVCLVRSALLSRKKFVITIFLHRPRREFIEYMLGNKVYTSQLKLCTKLHNMEPDICRSMTRQKHLFSEHWHVMYTVTFPFTQGRRCFPYIWIKSGSTMWLCDELLTIVVLALVNWFVHGRVPTAVNGLKW